MGSATVTTRAGRMELQLGDWGDQYIYVTGQYEDTTALAIASLLEPGDSCVDIGANVGFFTLLMAQRVGSEGSVWAFEPSPRTRRRLLRNLELNQLPQVTVREEALTDVEGTRRFFEGGEDHSGLASLRPLQGSTASYDVRTSRLSSCLPQSVRPRLIKMDIEGAEYLALQGMSDLLRRDHPDIVIEMTRIFLEEMGSSSAQVYEFLTGFGYCMYRIGWDGCVACGGWDSSLPSQFNALFTIRDVLPGHLAQIGEEAKVRERSAV